MLPKINLSIFIEVEKTRDLQIKVEFSSYSTDVSTVICTESQARGVQQLQSVDISSSCQ